ncbi:MAG: tetratricopeptide repeat protein [Saprospiraceae bacterium]
MPNRWTTWQPYDEMGDFDKAEEYYQEACDLMAKSKVKTISLFYCQRKVIVMIKLLYKILLINDLSEDDFQSQTA